MIAKFLAYLERDYLEESLRGYWIFLLALCMVMTCMFLLLNWPLEVKSSSSKIIEDVNTEERISLIDTFFETFSEPVSTPASAH